MKWSDVELYATKYAVKTAAQLSGLRESTVSADDLLEEFALLFIQVQPKFKPGAPRASCLAMFRQLMQWRVRDLMRAFGSQRRSVGFKVDVDMSLFEGPDMAHEREVMLAFEEAAERAKPPLRRFLVEALSGQYIREGETKEQAIKRITGWSSQTFYRRLNEWRDRHLVPALA